MKEEWKYIKDYEGLYVVSNTGFVKSVKRIVESEKATFVFQSKILKQEVAKGYLRVTLSKNNVQKKYLVHRLVANCFISKIENKNFVNHKDGNKKNNVVDNLEWCTSSENEIHSYKLLNKISGISKRCIDNNTGIIYTSIQKASKATGINKNTLYAKISGQIENNTGICLL